MNKARQRGQVSILIAIIFQVVFVFFAMVVNVGLVVSDKINLQNSVDIAAYYGAMKQAEVFNAMAHVNYQIRQIYKLLNWRLWVLADAGRNPAGFAYVNGGASGDPGDIAATWSTNGAAPVNEPLICIFNPYWADMYKGKKPTDNIENLCVEGLNIPPLPVITLQGAQILPLFSFLRKNVALSQQNANKFASNFKWAGADNYKMALKILVSYKYALLSRKVAMHRLQNLLVAPNQVGGQQVGQGDFKDLTGNSVKSTVERTLLKNLTAANKDGYSNDPTAFRFENSLHGNPFLVPIEIRVVLKYMDFPRPRNQLAVVKQFPEHVAPDEETLETRELEDAADILAGIDTTKYPAATAQSFAGVSDPALLNDFKSIAGYEKNPWVMGYVHLHVTTKPKMLFSPNGFGKRVELTADSYAMPFGGRIGPWYYDTWMPGQAQSTQVGLNKIDDLLPPRIGDPNEGPTVTVHSPNYSRFPGDKLGMSSQAARVLGFAAFDSGVSNLPHFQDDDYDHLPADPKDFGQDPVVVTDGGQPGAVSVIRSAELAGIAPDLFDASYYSINPRFKVSLGENLPDGGAYFFNSICVQCHDLGSVHAVGGNYTDTLIETQIQSAFAKMKSRAYWLLDDPAYLHTSWSQQQTDVYDFPQPKGIGSVESQGGRIGYSVKIVSRRYLTGPIPLSGGANPVAAPILNPPVSPD